MEINTRPSGISLHFEKYKANSGEINGLQRHNERVAGGRHGNKKINDERTSDNLILLSDEKKLNERIEKKLSENRTLGQRAVRKDAVRMIEGTVQLSGKILEQSEKEQVEFLKQAFEYMKEEFGAENFVSAVIHVDETTPHLHFDFVPIRNGKLTAKEIMNKTELTRYQSEFLKHAQKNYPQMNFKRGYSDTNGMNQQAFEKLMDEKKKQEQELAQFEKSLDDFEEKLDQREEKLNRLNAMYNKKNSDLGGREKALVEKSEKLKAAANYWKSKELDLNEREKMLKPLESELANNLTYAKNKLNEVKKREKLVKGQEDDLKAHEKRLEALKEEMDRLLENIAKLAKRAYEGVKPAFEKLSAIKRGRPARNTDEFKLKTMNKIAELPEDEKLEDSIEILSRNMAEHELSL